MTTKAQTWAQRRNFAKRRLRGVNAHLLNLTYGWGGETLTSWEKETLKTANHRVQEVLRLWEYENPHSKSEFIK